MRIIFGTGKFLVTVKCNSRFLDLLWSNFAVQPASTGVPAPQKIKTFSKHEKLIRNWVVFTLVMLFSGGVVAQQTTINSESGARTQPFLQERDLAAAKANEPSASGMDNPNDPAKPAAEPALKHSDLSFHWKAALLQSLLLLSVQRGGDMMTEADTRVNLRGPFFKDYVHSITNTHGWRDGDSSKTNYLGHPFQGAITGFIEIGNDPKGMHKKFEWTRSFWISRLKGLGWAAAYSTYFEIGPGISEAMIGNVGLPAKYRVPGSKPRPSNGGMGYVDMVITPTLGTAWLISEDILDRYIIAKMEKHTGNTFFLGAMRILLNPARSSANLLQMQKPWHRYSRGRDIELSQPLRTAPSIPSNTGLGCVDDP